MIQFLADQLNQLDLALDQLAVSDRNFDRFALMLVDNIVELVLHKHAESKIHHFRQIAGGDRNSPAAKTLAAGLGSFFDGKVKLALTTNLVTQEEAESLKQLHAFRNTAYHQGARHDGVLRAITLFYVRCACQLLKRFEPPVWTWQGEERLPHRAVKYLGMVDFFACKAAFKAAWDRVDQVALHHGDTMITDLYADMVKTIDNTDSDLEFLTTEGPSGQTRDGAVLDCQLWTYAYSAEAEEFAKAKGGPTLGESDYFQWLVNNAPWPAKNDPIPSWRSRAASLKEERNPHAALKKYGDFMRQTEKLRQAITDGVSDLNGWLDDQANQ